MIRGSSYHNDLLMYIHVVYKLMFLIWEGGRTEEGGGKGGGREEGGEREERGRGEGGRNGSEKEKRE